MMLHELIAASRSYRSFDQSQRLSREELASLVECARLSPSARNLQVLKFRLVSTEEECAKVFPLTRWAGLLKDMQIPPAGHEPTAYIVICMDGELTDAPDAFQRDVGIVAQSMMLAAAEKGFGGCMIGSCAAGDLKQVLSLPENLTPQLVLALGKPDEAVEITDTRDGNVDYYRKGGVHYVPKRSLEEIII